MRIIFGLALIPLLALSTKWFYAPSATEEIFKVPVVLQNNSEQDQEFALIWYAPLRLGNSTEELELPAGESIKRSYPVGTKLYVAGPVETGIVMGGGSLKEQPPFLKVKLGDKNKTFPIFK